MGANLLEALPLCGISHCKIKPGGKDFLHENRARHTKVNWGSDILTEQRHPSNGLWKQSGAGGFIILSPLWI